MKLHEERSGNNAGIPFDVIVTDAGGDKGLTEVLNVFCRPSKRFTDVATREKFFVI